MFFIGYLSFWFDAWEVGRTRLGIDAFIPFIGSSVLWPLAIVNQNLIFEAIGIGRHNLNDFPPLFLPNAYMNPIMGFTIALNDLLVDQKRKFWKFFNGFYVVSGVFTFLLFGFSGRHKSDVLLFLQLMTVISWPSRVIEFTSAISWHIFHDDIFFMVYYFDIFCAVQIGLSFLCIQFIKTRVRTVNQDIRPIRPRFPTKICHECKFANQGDNQKYSHCGIEI